MIQFRIDTSPSTLVRDLQQRVPKQINRAIKETVDEGLEYGRKELMDYPPPPRNSTYERTGTLGRGWERSGRGYKASGGETSAYLFNTVEYAQYVQGDRQARIHQGRWRPARDIAREVEEVTQKRLKREAEQIAAGLER